jgi:hypothetical protein
MVAPEPSEPLLLYIATTADALSMVHDRNHINNKSQKLRGRLGLNHKRLSQP